MTRSRHVVPGRLTRVTILIAGLSAVAPLQAAPSGCARSSFGRWSADCSGAFSFADANMDGSTVPDRLLLVRDGTGVRLVATMPLSHHRRFFTNTPPTVVEFEQPYVVDGLYFCGRTGPVLKVGGVEAVMEPDPRKSASGEPFTQDGASQYRVPPTAVEPILKALASSQKAELVHCQRGHGAGFVSVFDLSGFVEADAARAEKKP